MFNISTTSENFPVRYVQLPEAIYNSQTKKKTIKSQRIDLREHPHRKPWFLLFFYHEIWGFSMVPCRFSYGFSHGFYH